MEIKYRMYLNEKSLWGSIVFEFFSMIGWIDLVANDPSFFLKIFQVNMVGYSHVIGRSFEELLLCEDTLLRGLFFLFYRDPAKQVRVDILR